MQDVAVVHAWARQRGIVYRGCRQHSLLDRCRCRHLLLPALCPCLVSATGKHATAAHKEVEAESFVDGSREGALRPVGELPLRVWVHIAKGVSEAGLREHLRECPPLLGCEGWLHVDLLGKGVVYVQVQVPNVQVPRVHHWLALAQRLQVRTHVHLPLIDSVVQANQTLTRVGHIAGNEEEGVELESDGAALSVELLLALVLEVVAHSLQLRNHVPRRG
mmetsp:Transcript_2663/g.5708  ORF Transcript_2663/g.5708 Transcript_2663/m.5708 type:complete len:219 (+) Transcript_2663:114-770(+)